MAPTFVIPERLLEELEQDCEDRLCVARRINVTDEGAVELAKDVAFELGDKDVTCIEEQTLFDQLYALIKKFSTFEPSIKRILIETLCSNFTVIVANIGSLKRSESDPFLLRQQYHSLRNALKIYAYFLQQIYVSEEAASEQVPVKTAAPAKAKQPRKKHVTLAWDWSTFRSRIVCLLGGALEADLYQLYGMVRPDENLLSFFAKFGMKLLEAPNFAKEKDSKEALCRYLATCAVKYNFHEQLIASMADLLHKCEHAAVVVADVLAASEKLYADTKLAVGLLREIGLTNPAEYVRLGTVADNVKLFLVELAEKLPKVVAVNFSLLMPHFAGESYKIRNALVTVLGKLVAKAHEDSDSTTSEESRLRNKQGMLDILIERTRDTSAFTRSCVLQTWMYLCEQNALSIGLWNQVVDIAAGRLYDKAVLVRKSALQLLTTMLQYNPFGPQLRSGTFEATLEMYKEKLQKISAEPTSSQSQENPVAEEEVPSDSYGETQEPEPPLPPQGRQQVEQTRAAVASLEAALKFSKAIASTMPVVSRLLSSTAVFDVQHSIQFLTSCRKFSIDGSDECLSRMLPLVFSQEKSVSEAVESAFITIFMKDKSPQETAFCLLQLTLEAQVGDLASIEALAVTLMNKNEISAATISALWDIFTFNSVAVTPEQCRGALTLLSMFAKASPAILSPRIQNIVDIGFGRRANEDIMLARFACIALQRISSDDKRNLQPGHKVFNILSSLIIGPGLPDRSWYSTAEQAINAIYAIHPTPESFASSLIIRFSEIVFGGKDNEDRMADLQGISSNVLGRFLFAAGHVALKHLVYMETCARVLRKQRADKEKVAAEAASDRVDSGSQKEENINTELGVAASDDLKLDILMGKAEKEVVSGGEARKFLIGNIAPVVTKLCRNLTLLQQFPRLRSSAVLCLCKFMVVDAQFCDENLQLLFTLAQNSAEESLRSNCIISLGDIAFRFPNLLEPWTEHMYGRLHDKSTHVRKNAVLVIAHLILNDMMKVKGHISEMVLLIDDEDSRVSDLAKLFFLELSKKGTSPIYNLMPDILSRLSSSSSLSSDRFRSLMQYLISFVKKDKQTEGLADKMCNRFSGTSDRKQWQAIAYCLSQLNYSEKGMKKLVDSFKHYQNALVDEQVFDYFTTICGKAKKLGKQDFRQVVEEFEDTLRRCHERKKEEEHEAQKAQTGRAEEQNSASDDAEAEQDDGGVGESPAPDEQENAGAGDGPPGESLAPDRGPAPEGGQELAGPDEDQGEQTSSLTEERGASSPSVSDEGEVDDGVDAEAGTSVKQEQQSDAEHTAVLVKQEPEQSDFQHSMPAVKLEVDF